MLKCLQAFSHKSSHLAMKPFMKSFNLSTLKKEATWRHDDKFLFHFSLNFCTKKGFYIKVQSYLFVENMIKSQLFCVKYDFSVILEAHNSTINYNRGCKKLYNRKNGCISWLWFSSFIPQICLFLNEYLKLNWSR